jgi:UDP-glucuronate 4-epimerase
MSRFLVTGAAGFIGSHLAESLLEDGHDVLGVDCFTDYYPEHLKTGNVAGAAAHGAFELVREDISHGDIGSLVARCDGVFHLAAQPGVRGSWGDGFAVYLRDNLAGTQRVFEAATRAGVRVVFASSSSVYGDVHAYPTSEDAPLRPVSPYGVTKLACESLAGAYAQSTGLDFVGLRYFTVYGPRQRPDMALTRILRATVAGTPFELFGSGQQSRDVTYVGDAVSATRAAMEGAPAGSILNVGGGVEISMRELISRCERLVGRELDLRERPVAEGDVRRTSADTSRIASLVGWSPSTTIDEGLRAQLAWVRATHG